MQMERKFFQNIGNQTTRNPGEILSVILASIKTIFHFLNCKCLDSNIQFYKLCLLDPNVSLHVKHWPDCSNITYKLDDRIISLCKFVTKGEIDYLNDELALPKLVFDDSLNLAGTKHTKHSHKNM